MRARLKQVERGLDVSLLRRTGCDDKDNLSHDRSQRVRSTAGKAWWRIKDNQAVSIISADLLDNFGHASTGEKFGVALSIDSERQKLQTTRLGWYGNGRDVESFPRGEITKAAFPRAASYLCQSMRLRISVNQQYLAITLSRNFASQIESTKAFALTFKSAGNHNEIVPVIGGGSIFAEALAQDFLLNDAKFFGSSVVRFFPTDQPGFCEGG